MSASASARSAAIGPVPAPVAPTLDELAARIGADPAAARERCLPVDDVFADLLPDTGLMRGRVFGCSGPAAWSLAFALAARAVTTGSWMAVVGVPSVGVEAAGELGVPLGRLVVIAAEGSPSVWAERVAAAADGFEVIVTRPPAGGERVVRRVRQRLQTNGAVLIAVDPVAPHVACDLDITTAEAEWAGIGSGHGHLAWRRVVVRVGGRRAPRAVERELLVPGPGGRVQAVVTEPVSLPVSLLDRAG